MTMDYTRLRDVLMDYGYPRLADENLSTMLRSLSSSKANRNARDVIAISWIVADNGGNSEWAESIYAHRDASHIGGCGVVSETCPRCYVDSVLRNVDLQLAALEAAGYAVVRTVQLGSYEAKAAASTVTPATGEAGRAGPTVSQISLRVEDPDLNG